MNFIEEKKSNDDETLPINSVVNCLQALTQCHETIAEQEASRFDFVFRLIEKRFFLIFSSSSDSDSDPEGGEIPDLSYNKNESGSKKKLKKKRSDKAIEDRIDKLNKKREVKRRFSQHFFSSFLRRREVVFLLNRTAQSSNLGKSSIKNG